MSEKVEEKRVVEAPQRRRDSRSLFAPLVLIAAGVYFLLANLELLPDLYWESAFRLWPVLLIFLGLNLIVMQFRPPWGTLFSGLVAVATVSFFSWVLLTGAGQSLPAGAPDGELQREEISFEGNDLSFASVEIDFSAFPSTVESLSDSRNLIEGSVTYRDELQFESQREGNEATVRLDTSNVSSFFSWMNPNNWFNTGNEEGEWQLGLNPDVPLDLRLDLSSGSARLDLSELTLDYLEIDGSSGTANVQLPPGNYDTRYDISSGTVTVELPESGEPTISVDGGSGALSLHVPPSMAARIIVEDGGSGGLRTDDRFTRIDGGDDDEGTWQTGGYESADHRATIILDIGSGSVSVR